MLKNNLTDIPGIALMRSDQILDNLVGSLFSSLSSRSSANTLSEVVHTFHPNRYRESDLTAACQCYLEGAYCSDYSFDFIDNIFNRFFEYNGSYLTAKEGNAENYGALIRHVHPFSIIGYRCASKLYQGEITLDDLDKYATCITPLAIKRRSFHKDYAEGHIHLGGSNEPHGSLLSLSNQDRTIDKLYKDISLTNLPRLTDFPLLTGKLYTLGQIVDLFKETHTALIGAVYYNNYLLDDSKSTIRDIKSGRKRHTVQRSKCNLDFLRHIPHRIGGGLKQQVLVRLLNAYSTGDDEQAWFYYSVLLHLLHKDENSTQDVRCYVKMLFHLSHILRAYMVMSQNIGLAHFVGFFDSTLRKNTRNFHRNLARNVIMNGTTHLEGKVAPNVFTTNEKYDFMEAFDDAIKEELINAGPSLRAANRFTNHRNDQLIPDVYSGEIPYHFCIHFIRKADDKPLPKKLPPSLAVRHAAKREEVKKQGLELDQILSGGNLKRVSSFAILLKRGGSLIDIFRNKKQLEERCLDITRLFVALDVAGNETDTPPEVYAPIIRYLCRDVRSHRPTALSILERGALHHKRMRLSVHAGEDFSHIVTGMRRIDETVKFYNYRAKDRLGHALALGLSPKIWAQKSLETFITMEEHLDNLVWLWKRCIELGTVYCDATAHAKKYEVEIAYFADKIYRQSGEKEIPPEDLYVAWELRSNCPLTESKVGKSFSAQQSDFIRHAIPDFCDIKDHNYQAESLYRRYHTDRVVRKKGQEILPVRYVGSKYVATREYVAVTDDELKLFEALQDFLLSRYAEQEIIIEANPSSNVYIADIGSYSEHPIFRWNPPNPELLKNGEQFNKYGLRRGSVKVCINTDDPAIFPTTLQNEFRLIKQVAQDKFECCESVAEDWIERIRILGVEIFLENHMDPVVINI